MNQFFVKPSLRALIYNPPPFEVLANVLIYKLFPRSLRPIHTPLSLVLYVTKRCNFKCEFCFTYDTLNKADWNQFELDLNGFKKILDTRFGRRALRVGLLGGEPFLNPLIFEFLKECHLRGKITTVVTNASLIGDQEQQKLLVTAPTMLGLSWYENNHEKVLNLSQWLSANKKEFWVQTVIGKNEISQMITKINLAKKNNIKNLIFSNYNPFYSKNIENVIFEDCKNYLEVEAEVKSLAKAYKINLTLPHLIKRNPQSRNCNMPFSYIHVDNTGTIGSCCFRAPDKKYGNLYEPDSWNNEENLKLRESFLDSSKPTISPCTYCENLSRDLYGF